MSAKPIFVATHPRSCSTAFERVFMTRPDLKCIHEPFGDAFYYGPERLSSRFEADELERTKSGFSESTFQTVLDRIEKEGDEGKRLFIKDIIYYLFPPTGKPASIAPACARKARGIGTSPFPNRNGSGGGLGVSKDAPYLCDTYTEPGNPTVIPSKVLDQFHFTFLIRHPRSSIPSYYRCTVPPLDKVTGFYDFMPSEAGYDELRRFFDFLRSVGQIGPRVATGNTKADLLNGSDTTHKASGKVDICVVDADDLLDNPAGIIEAYCKSTKLQFNERMLKWDSEEHHRHAKEAFEKWKGFHEDAIESCDLKPRTHKKKVKTEEEEDVEWTEKFGAKAAKVIRETVNANVADYEYLKQFALVV